MSDLTRLDDGTYEDSTGEMYSSFDLTCIVPSHEERLDFIVRQLKVAVEELVSIRIGSDFSIQPTELDEYIRLLSACNFSKIDFTGNYTYACESIAEDAFQNKNLTDAFTSSFYIFSADVSKIRLAYKTDLIAIAEELIHYRTLQRIRVQLKENDLAQYIERLFVKQVTSLAERSSKSVIEEIKAELSLLLSASEEEHELRREYTDRLKTYKDKALVSVINQHTFESIAWRCFMPQYLQGCCSDYINSNIHWYSTDIELDLALTIKRYLIPGTITLYQHSVLSETAGLASEWLVLEWIKNRLTPKSNVIQPSIFNVDKSVESPSIGSKLIIDSTITTDESKSDNPQQSQLESRIKIDDEMTLMKCFEHISKYKTVMNLLVEKEFCQANTYIWKDMKAGYKGVIVRLIKTLHAQGYYRNNILPSNEEIPNIALNTFGVKLSADLAKKESLRLNEFSYVIPAAAQ